MSEIRNTKTLMRVIHRYLGYFMAGIMAVYAISGILLIYRDTDFLKKEIKTELVIGKNLNDQQLPKALDMRKIRIDKKEGGIVYFNRTGTYNSKTGEAQYTTKELPYVLDKMTSLHKASSEDSLSFLNLIFGLSLFFYVVSSFWMFPPKSKIFKRGMIYTAAGFVLALILLFI